MPQLHVFFFLHGVEVFECSQWQVVGQNAWVYLNKAWLVSRTPLSHTHTYTHLTIAHKHTHTSLTQTHTYISLLPLYFSIVLLLLRVQAVKGCYSYMKVGVVGNLIMPCTNIASRRTYHLMITRCMCTASSQALRVQQCLTLCNVSMLYIYMIRRARKHEFPISW